MENWSLGKSILITDLGMCVNHYRLSTVGLFACINVGIKIDSQLITSDMIVSINAGKRKQCEADFTNNYFIGPPNFVLDVLNNPAEIEQRKVLFSKAGVEEYLIINEELTEIEWNRQSGKKFKRVEPERGIIKSSSLPGLWMSVDALKERDWWTIMARIDQGITRRDHHELMQDIWKK